MPFVRFLFNNKNKVLKRVKKKKIKKKNSGHGLHKKVNVNSHMS